MTENLTDTVLKVGDWIKHEWIWAEGRDFGDGQVEQIGSNYVVLRENFYEQPVLYRGEPQNLLPFVIDAPEDDDDE